MYNHTSINKKWINSVINCESYSSFEGESSDHRIISLKIHLSLCRNKYITGIMFYLLNPLSWGKRDDSLKALNLMSIKDAVNLSIWMRRLPPLS